ncbi:unnamed protein product [Brassica oleracea]|uniref:Phosphatidylinositol N-acetylglucosaminyltransferase subunit H conserved domain-containing protein n=3 Tax=Brassica TaxID=3705 RepID=A0A0D3A1R3_BRAOL|nr:unnamed protein product [Brassica napus]VDD47941.1 unnamed protein product [Brassica oleracea]
MVSSSLSNKRYTYIHESESVLRRGAIDIHHVIINRSRSTGYARRMGLAFFLVILGVKDCFIDAPSVFSSRGCLRWIIHMKQDNPVVLELSVKWFLCYDTKSEASKESCSESVIIMPTFGIQLETQYLSGKTVSRFIPIGKILKPVLVECVTPVTCYIRELRPSLKMLVPIWKALCAVIGTDQSEMITDEKHDASGKAST